jgi:hypothetical protein
LQSNLPVTLNRAYNARLVYGESIPRRDLH